MKRKLVSFPLSFSYQPLFPILNPITYNRSPPSGDDLCGISMSTRFNTNLISIWHRRADASSSKEGILRVVKETIAPDLKEVLVDGSYYYKRHSEHAGFSELVARARETEPAKTVMVDESEGRKGSDDGRIFEAEVDKAEGERALLKDEEVA